MGRLPTEDPDEPDVVVVDLMDVGVRGAIQVSFDAVADVDDLDAEPPAQLAQGSSVLDLDELSLQLVESSETFGDITAAIEAAALEAALHQPVPPSPSAFLLTPPTSGPARRMSSTMPPANQGLVIRTDDRVGIRKR